jgi:iron complex transport system ATP-binding protein
MYHSDDRLIAQQLSAGYSAEAVIKNLDLKLPAGSITAVIGANGSGKSSLLKALARKLAPQSGAVLMDGVSLSSLTRTEVSERIGLLAAIPAGRASETVFELVARSAQSSLGISRTSPKLRQEIELLLARTGIAALADTRLNELSSGARQCAVIAAALVRNPEVLLLDEPTSSLDYSHQLEVINLLSSLKRERGMTIVAVIHDLNLAARFADRVVILRNGQIIAHGTPAEVITPSNLASAFNILARVIEDPVGKTPLVIPIRQLG